MAQPVRIASDSWGRYGIDPDCGATTMLHPPFKFAASTLAAAASLDDDAAVACSEGFDADDDSAASPNGRHRLAQLDSHLHCSLLGTCLGQGSCAS